MENSTAGQQPQAATAPVITKGDVLNMHAALGILGNRMMATVNADEKTGRLLRHVTPFAQDYQRGEQRKVLEIVEDLDLTQMSPLQQQVVAAKIAIAQSEYKLEPAEGFALPKGTLSNTDMPKEKTGADGWKNAQQIGAITSDLGALYVFMRDE